MAKNQQPPKTPEPEAAPAQAPGSEFTIQRIYIKDLSFEAPHVPALFQNEWKPDTNLQIQTNSTQLATDVHEVTLKVTITTNTTEKTAFLIEVVQGGVFTIKKFNDEQTRAILGSVCPNILFPYVREIISDLSTRGTFPPLYLAPVNFDALYAQHLAQQKDGKTTEGSTTH